MRIKNILFNFLLCSFSFSAFADSSCGDPTKGQFVCDTDTIRVTYGADEILRNNWVNQNATANDIFVAGPVLNLYGEFKTIQVTGDVSLNSTLQQTIITRSLCPEPEHAFDIVLSASNSSGKTVSLDTFPITVEAMYSQDRPGNMLCTLNGSFFYQDVDFKFFYDYDYSQYRDFQLKINNLTIDQLDPELRPQIKDFVNNRMKDIFGTEGKSWYLQLVGIK